MNIPPAIVQLIKDLYLDMCVENQDDCPSDYRARMRIIYNEVIKAENEKQ